MTVVDVHAHVVVPGLGSEVAWENGAQVIRDGGREIRSALREFCDLPRILEEQDRAGIDKILLCPWVNLLGRDPDRQNEALAAMVGERVAALGTVPLDEPDRLIELMRDGRLSGVEIPASEGGDYLGHPRFGLFWAAAEESGALVFIHPTTRGFRDPVFDDHYLWNTVGNPFETTITAAHMVLAGVLDEHPRVKVVLAHGGGAVPALRGRLLHEQRVHARERDVVLALRRFYYDTVVHDADVLRGLVEFAGTDHVLLGSDYPFDMGDERPAELVRSLGLPATDEWAILGGNALALLGQVVST